MIVVYAFCLPIGNFARPFAQFLLLIKDLAQFTAVATWHLSIHAHIEELTVLGIGVTRMGDGHRLIHLGTLEFKDVCRLAAGNADLIRPSADAGLGIEDEASRTGDHIELAIDAIVEFVTDAGLFMAKVSILPGTMLTGLRSLCKRIHNTVFSY